MNHFGIERVSFSKSSLPRAVENDDIETVKMFLSAKAEVNQCMTNGETSLHVAVKRVNEEIVSLLLKHGANVNAHSRTGRTPLHIAAVRMHNPIAENLLNYGASVNCTWTITATDDYTQRDVTKMYTPLHLALESPLDEEMVKLLLQRGADINFQYTNGETILYSFVEDGNFDAVEHILSLQPDVNKENNRKALHAAILSNHIESKNMTEALLNYGFKITREDATDFILFYAAIEQGYLKIVEMLLRVGINPDVHTLNIDRCLVNLNSYATEMEVLKMDRLLVASYNTPLLVAVTTSNASMVKLILECKVNVNFEYDDGENILHVAVRNGKFDVVKLLLEYETNVDAIDKQGNSILHTAVKARNKNIVQLLLSYQPDVNTRDMYEKTALEHAIRWELEGIVKLILEYANNVCSQNANGYSLLCLAIKTGNLNIVNCILSNSTKVDSDSNQKSVYYAIASPRSVDEIVEALVNYGIDISYEDANNKEFLYNAVKNGSSKLVDIVLTKRRATVVTPSMVLPIAEKMVLPTTEKVEDISRLLNVTCRCIYKKVTEVLLSYGGDAAINAADEYGYTALANAVSNNVQFTLYWRSLFEDKDMRDVQDIVKMLLGNGADCNVTVNSGDSIVHLACRDVNEPNVVQMLLDHGVNKETKDRFGNTPLHVAAKECNDKIAEVLLSHGADVESKNDNGDTPLYVAAQSQCANVVGVLLKFGANVDSKNADGMTALHLLAKGLNDSFLIYLLHYGADVNCLNNENKTPYYDHNVWALGNDYEVQDIPLPSDDGNDDVEVDKHFLTKHILKLKTANLYLCSQNLELADKFVGPNVQCFLQDCRNELANLKVENVNGSKITLFDILNANNDQLVRYARDESLVEALIKDSVVYECRFSLYFYIIRNNLRRGLIREKLLNLFADSLKLLLNFEMPYPCASTIFQYLENSDLISLNKSMGILNPTFNYFEF